MTYIYDIILNFTDINLYYESYEWNNNDHLINVKKAPIFKVSTKIISDIINYKIKVNIKFLSKISNQSSLFRKDKNNISYLAILSNGEKTIGISLDNDGYIIYKSSLLIDEEIEANTIANKLKETEIKYIKCSKLNTQLLLRDSVGKRDYLIKEIKKIYKSKKYEKLKYIYYELYEDIIDDTRKMYEILLDNFNNYSYEYDRIYNILKEQYKYAENQH